MYGAYAWWLYYIADDAYITFRYSRNLARGAGLRYNPGEHTPVEGYSNFGWMVLAAPVEALGLDVARTMNLVSIAAGGVLLARVHHVLAVLGVDRAVAGATTVALAASASFVGWSTSGLETMAFALTVWLTAELLVLAPERRAMTLGAAAATALALMRTEAIAWVWVIGALGAATRALVIHRRDQALPSGSRASMARACRSVAVAVGVATLVWSAYSAARYAWFQSWLSNTAKAKLGGGVDDLMEGGRYVLSTTLSAPAPVLAGLIGLRAVRRDLRLVAFVLLAVAFPTWAMVVGGDYMPFGRLMMAGVPFAYVLLGAGLARVPRPAALAVAGAIAVLGALPAHGVTFVPEAVRRALHFRTNTTRVRTELEQLRFLNVTTRNWSVMGETVGRHAAPDARWATGAIGARGYFSDLFIYDVGGLVTREVAELPGRREGRSPGHEKSVSDLWFLKYQPDLLRSRKIDGRRNLAREARAWRLPAHVKEAYVPEALPVDGAEDRWVLVLRRVTDGDDPTWIWAHLDELSRGTPRGLDFEAASAATSWTRVFPGQGSAQQEGSMARLRGRVDPPGTQAPEGDPGVEIADPDAVAPGANLVVSAGRPATLVGRGGEVLFQWRVPFGRAFPGAVVQDADPHTTGPRRVALLPSGDLLMLFQHLGIARASREGEVRWALLNGAHDDLAVDADHTVWVLTRHQVVVEQLHPTRGLWEATITQLDGQGEVVRRLSLLEALVRSPHRTLLEGRSLQAEPLSVDSLAVLDGSHVGRHPAFAQGNLLLTSAALDAVLVVDPDQQRAVWALTEGLGRPTDAVLTRDGDLLLFDSAGAGPRRSRAVVVDPATGEPGWAFGHKRRQPLPAPQGGTVQPLANGHTLVVWTAHGRAYELDGDGKVVWRYHGALAEPGAVAPLYQVERVAPERLDPWLTR